MEQISNKIRQLIDYLNERTKEYDEGHPTISDAEWDKYYFELQKLENEYSIYFNDSPTQSISYEVVNTLEKVTHNHDMLSLEKTKSLDNVKDFLGTKPYLAMCKMDGLTCSLKYVNGELVSAETRGNGKVGENILHNAKIIPSIPKRIPYLNTLIIDGEIICTKNDFKEFEKEYANPRNFASGSIRLLDAKECSKRKLRFVAWDIIEGLEDSIFLTDKFVILSTFGFTIVPYYVYNNYEEEINKLTLEAEKLYYPIDGIVFKFDDVEYGRSLGQTSHHFKNAIAFKFVDDSVESELIDIEWSMGRTSVLTPVAIFKETELEGSKVSRASLHNLSVLWEILGEKPYKGQKIEIIKSNMIIPQIKASIPYEEVENKKDIIFIQIPKTCPICGEPVFQKTEIISTMLICTNPKCKGQLINKLDYFTGKKGLDIKGLSKATLGKLIEWNWVLDYKDLFELKKYRDEWAKKPGFGAKSVDNILNAIENSKECELSAFIASLGIPLIGTTAAKELSSRFLDWDSFISAVESKYHFWEIPNFGEEMHSAIISFDYREAKEIYQKYLKIKMPQNTTPKEINLNELVFVITGKLSHFKNRDELKKIIELNGGKVVNSITGKTSYLINNDLNSTSSKNLKAKQLNIPIISEENFIKLLEK